MTTSSCDEAAVALMPGSRNVRTRVAGFSYALVSIVIFSGWFVITRLGLKHELKMWDVIAIRFGGGALLLTPILLFGKTRLPFGTWFTGLPLAFLWGAPFILLVGFGLQLTSATLASSVAPALMPVFAAAIAWIAGEIPNRRHRFGYATIMVGLLSLIGSYVVADGLPNPIGIFFLIVAAAMWGIYTVRLRSSGLTSLQATALICFWSAVLFLPIYFLFIPHDLARASVAELALQSLYQGVLMSVVAIFSFNRAVSFLGPTAASAIVAMVPVATTAFAVPILGELPSMFVFLAVAVIAIGVMLATERDRTSPTS